MDESSLNTLASGLDRVAARLADLPDALVCAFRPSPHIGVRAEPRKVDWSLALESVPGFAAIWSVVPDEFWQRDSGVAVVACPCGGDPPCVPCDGTAECPDCHRFYLNGGDVSVFVTNTPKTELWTTEDWDAAG